LFKVSKIDLSKIEPNIENLYQKLENSNNHLKDKYLKKSIYPTNLLKSKYDNNLQKNDSNFNKSFDSAIKLTKKEIQDIDTNIIPEKQPLDNP